MAEDVVLEVRVDPAERVVVAAVGTEPPAEARSWVVPVSGGRVSVDLDDLDAPPRASLHDPGWAHTWLTEVYGAELGAVVASNVPGRALYRPGLLSAPLTRLGVGLWLRRWWPADGAGVPPLDEELHEIELAALGWRLEACLVDLAWPAQALRDRRAALVAAVAALRQRGQGRRGELVREVLLRAVNATVSMTDDASDAASEVRAIRAELVAEERSVAALTAGGWESLVEALSDLLVPTPVLKGGGGADLAQGGRSGTTTADWRQVPPRTVSGREGSVRWTIAHDRVEATVDPAYGLASLRERLKARFAIGGVELDVPLELSHDADGQTRLKGSGVIGPGQAADAPVTVDVVSAARATRRRTDPDGLAEARTDREAIVSTISQRVANVPSHLDEPSLSWRAPFVAELLGRQWEVARS